MTKETERWAVTESASTPDLWCVVRLKDGHIEHRGTLQECNALVVRFEHEDQLDAKRYRWLRDHGHIIFLGSAERVDQTVDREMAKPPAECNF